MPFSGQSKADNLIATPSTSIVSPSLTWAIVPLSIVVLLTSCAITGKESIIRNAGMMVMCLDIRRDYKVALPVSSIVV